MAEEIKNEAPAKDAKKGKKKWPIVAGVVAVVLVAAGAGFFVWHEQPSFCNAICHTPMDAYVETVTDGSHDKFGNELDQAGMESMMAFKHAGSLDAGGYEVTNCLGCHVPSMAEQITEGMHWVTGSYSVAGENKVGQTILETRELADLVEARGIEEDEFCLNSGCHATADGTPMTREDLVERTADLSDTRNPHVAQHGEYACSQCHKAHSQSVNYCSQCHADAPVPEGWLSAIDAKKLAI